ncbi:hypothetical protein OT109_19260 [Phycisphaeraceae bacterium D3-23]
MKNRTKPNGGFYACALLAAVSVSALPVTAQDFAVSTANSAGFTGGPGIGPGEAYAFNSNNPAGATKLVELTIGNLNAFHILDNGNYLLSAQTGSTFGSNAFVFDDDHVVEYNPNTDIVSSFFDFGAAPGVSGSDLDIDAVAVLPNGDIIFSNLNDVTIGATTFSSRDVIQFTPVAGTVTNVQLLFDGDLITGGDQFNNVQGASVDGDILALSVASGGASDIMLGGQTFTRADVVLYNLTTGTATLGFDGDVVFANPPTIDAVHLTIPEPGTATLALGLLALVGRRRR